MITSDMDCHGRDNGDEASIRQGTGGDHGAQDRPGAGIMNGNDNGRNRQTTPQPSSNGAECRHGNQMASPNQGIPDRLGGRSILAVPADEFQAIMSELRQAIRAAAAGRSLPSFPSFAGNGGTSSASTPDTSNADVANGSGEHATHGQERIPHGRSS